MCETESIMCLVMALLRKGMVVERLAHGNVNPILIGGVVFSTTLAYQQSIFNKIDIKCKIL